ncbi:hypothetical protein ACNVED_16770 (plasmid) [Legionella sp. D16C41]|uniref:hypothetical protein n=1 Tax=Legionella sp. D16C41 TaxID=3402688 RepID=UPI003AF8D4BD
MKIVMKINNLKNAMMRFTCMVSAMLITAPLFAEDTGGDVVGDFLQQSLKGIFGSNAGFWKIFILADIALATLAVMKSKNPTVFVGVFMTALVPGFLVKRYVFPAA